MPAVTPLPTPPSRSDPTNFAVRGDAFLGALPQLATEINAAAVALTLNSTTDTSTSSVAIALGSATFAVTAGKSFQPGMYLVFADTAAPTTNSMFGQVASYSGTSLTVNVIGVRGSGTKAAWVISQCAPGGAAAGANTDITSLNSPSLGAATATTAAKNDISTKVATTAFVNPGNLLASPGYQKLPSGLTMQWGSPLVGVGGTTITFPIAFTTAFNVVAFPEYGTNPSNSFISTNGLTNTGFGAIVSQGTIGFRWIAIGLV